MWINSQMINCSQCKKMIEGDRFMDAMASYDDRKTRFTGIAGNLIYCRECWMPKRVKYLKQEGITDLKRLSN